MSIKNDLKYPFGNPVEEMFNERLLVALSNTLKLAREWVWIAEGRPIGLENADYSDHLDQTDLPKAKTGFNDIESLILDVRKGVYGSGKWERKRNIPRDIDIISVMWLNLNSQVVGT